MIRLDRNDLTQLWLILKAHLGRLDFFELRGRISDQRNLTRDDEYLIDSLSDIGPPDYDLLEADLKKQLTAKGSFSDGETLREIIEVISSSHARNRMTGSILQALRSALLTPGEHAKLRETLREEEFHCAKCRHKFGDGEAVTFRTEKVFDGTRTISHAVICCSRCDQPRVHACSTPNCAGHFPVPQRVVSGLGHAAHFCPKCAKEKGLTEAKRKDGASESDQVSVAIPIDGPLGGLADTPPQVARYRTRLFTVDGETIPTPRPPRGAVITGNSFRSRRAR